MTTVPRQLAIFAAVLAVLFAGGYAAGHVIGPSEHGTSGGGHESGGGGHEAEPQATEVHGLGASENGLRLAIDASPLERGRLQDLRFQVLDERDDAPVLDYDIEHTKRMHMILVRRDLTGFQHLHPELDASGTWQVQVRFAEPGSYRLFADFTHEGTKTTLAGDLQVPGDAELQPLPDPAPLAESDDGYQVRLESGEVASGEPAKLGFVIQKDGNAVDTEPYLGAGGHLVALREGELAFLHVHPDDEGVGFTATFPSAGRYRLFLQFQHEGRVRTVAFTQEVG